MYPVISNKYDVKTPGSNPGRVLGECCGVYSGDSLFYNCLSIDTNLLMQAAKLRIHSYGGFCCLFVRGEEVSLYAASLEN